MHRRKKRANATSHGIWERASIRTLRTYLLISGWLARWHFVSGWCSFPLSRLVSHAAFIDTLFAHPCAIFIAVPELSPRHFSLARSLASPLWPFFVLTPSSGPVLGSPALLVLVIAHPSILLHFCFLRFARILPPSLFSSPHEPTLAWTFFFLPGSAQVLAYITKRAGRLRWLRLHLCPGTLPCAYT